MESNARLQQDSDANRGSDWLHHDDQKVAFQELPTWKFRRGESRYYALASITSIGTIRNFDVVLFGGWESPAYWSLLAAAVVLRKGRVGFYESPSSTMTYASGFIAWLRKSFFRSMNVVVVPGRAAAEAVLGMGVDPSRIMQGFNAVDVNEFHSASLARMEDSGAADTHHRYLYVGQLIERKRVDAIVKAYAEIATTSDELTIVGTGAMREELIMADRRGASISFIGQVENREIPKIMARHQTLILASQQEVWGLVVNEALAAGMHVVVTDNCGVLPSVVGMRGVYVAKSSLVDLPEQLRNSRADWAGRIEKPEILQHTPERFAEVFEAAFAASVR
ncbi:glycosyltransferase family 4 protein [Arthrobacter sp. AFG20]|uniref:glycosyltransferase family 4 protein n=1 Tax=Arthrobacter sp. AFG20 TaxID=1688671 RepID=UPI0015E0923B|nr:glycosyltransferase family 4 protein [Arthrobacter sp. AFG20]